jgi:hypothetical protein
MRELENETASAPPVPVGEMTRARATCRTGVRAPAIKNAMQRATNAMVKSSGG